MFANYIEGLSSFSFNGGFSSVVSVKHGVPQGSVLGPALFLIYVNDIVNFQPNSNLIMYADDTTVFQSYHPLDNFRDAISETLSNISNWFLANKLSLNVLKTQEINFSLRNHNHHYHGLYNSEPVKFLGVHVDAKLTWREHVDRLNARLSRIIYLIRSLSKMVPF